MCKRALTWFGLVAALAFLAATTLTAQAQDARFNLVKPDKPAETAPPAPIGSTDAHIKVQVTTPPAACAPVAEVPLACACESSCECVPACCCWRPCWRLFGRWRGCGGAVECCQAPTPCAPAPNASSGESIGLPAATTNVEPPKPLPSTPAVDPAAVKITSNGVRQWTDSTGKYHAQARYVDFREGKVGLDKADGTFVRVAMERLSQADQEFVHNQNQSLALAR